MCFAASTDLHFPNQEGHRVAAGYTWEAAGMTEVDCTVAGQYSVEDKEVAGYMGRAAVAPPNLMLRRN